MRHLRTVGALRGLVAADGTPAEQLVAEARALPTMAGQELASRVTCGERYVWSHGPVDVDALAAQHPGGARGAASPPAPGAPGPVARGESPAAFPSELPLPAAHETTRFRVIAYDYGIKRNILRLLVSHNCEVTVVPAQTSAEDVLSLKPDGVFLSNGPGDPEPVGYAIENIRKLAGRVPIFGICLGHQLCGLALGGKTYKLKFGHHGSNHPVKNLLTEKVEITAQNHGFAVEPDSLPSSEVEITHLNLNDHTNEGLRHRSLPLFSVQYHPEASPGPHDSQYLFNDFIHLMTEFRRGI